MASSFIATRSLISAKRLLSRSGGLKRHLLPRSFISLENRACSQFLKQAPLSRPSGLRPVRPVLVRFNSTAGIVKSEFTIEIPEISVSDFVLSKFNEYGDDIATVSL